MNLKQSICIITGAARGIGLATAQALSEREAHVVLTDLDEAALQSAASLFEPEKAVPVQADVRSPGDLEAVAATALERWGRLDVWINNAGLARHRPIVDYEVEDLELMMDVNLKGTVLGCQTALRAMIPRRSGHIINLISTASLRGIPTESFYCATKWAVRGFTQALQEEAASHNVRATAILPGGVDTAFWDHAVERAMPVEDFLTPRQVADAIVCVLEQDDSAVVRELVLRSIKDRDFASA